jgi:hypothetical protein
MARDPLQVLNAMRRRQVEQARQALAMCLQAEAAAAGRISAIDDAARQDREAHRKLSDAHRFLDMFALRLASMQANRRGAAADFHAAQDRSAEAREAVVTARMAAEGVETLIAERLVGAAMETARKEQHALDDISRGRCDRNLAVTAVGSANAA